MMWIRIAAALGFLGVALGAFGAHALKTRLSPEMLTVWHTGVLYHMLHAAALLALALYARAAAAPAPIAAPAMGFLMGILLFSGSLYALALTGIKPLGAITPFGGLSFLFAWAWIAIKAV